MRIHTDTLNEQDVWQACRALGLYPERLSTHKSRKRKHGIELQISGSSPRMAQSGDWQAATWDEWGALLGRLFNLDPTMTCTYYVDAEFFHEQTDGRFKAGDVPEDTHAQHKWCYDFEKSQPWGGSAVHYCNKCSARMTR
jgi:hypothetical protein